MKNSNKFNIQVIDRKQYKSYFHNNIIYTSSIYNYLKYNFRFINFRYFGIKLTKYEIN